VFSGHGGIRHHWETLQGLMPNFRSDPQRFFDAGDSVVAATVVSGTGGGSEVTVAGEVGMLWTFRDGKIVRCVVHRELGDALEAVGLRQ
jgi:ketosteroid isomerase-like protein